MATNLALSQELITTALRLGHHKTKREAVTVALKQYITHKKQLKILNLFGTLEFDKRYDYKKARRR